MPNRPANAQASVGALATILAEKENATRQKSTIALSGFLSWRVIYVIPALLGIVLFVISIFYLKDFNYRGAFKISYLATLREPAVIKLFAFICIASFFYHSLQQWLGVYLSQEYSFHQLARSMIFTIASLIAIFSENIGGALAIRFGAPRVGAVGFISMSVFLLLLTVIPLRLAVFVSIALWGMGWAFNHVSLSSILTDLPDQYLRDASSLNSALRFIAGGAGTFFGGVMIKAFGFKAHFLIVACILLILGIVLNRQLFSAKTA